MSQARARDMGSEIVYIQDVSVLDIVTQCGRILTTGGYGSSRGIEVIEEEVEHDLDHEAREGGKGSVRKLLSG